MSSSSVAEKAVSLETLVEQLAHVDLDADASDAAIKKLVTAAVKAYSYKVQREGGFPIMEGGALTPTDAMIACTALLRGVNVQVFELGCWQGWMG
jgi:hypothetical protein